eukprot:CAMPEP_0119554578 /NCGR_PEP_ID=MMETSP1352-20130426/7034_1 /TAXON_ID=265584 /ORGANISM="Stauroneis constricta, Strain CCMP1120" /LENGTH=410 /DNA_ID=CAMNT_0007601191 /DNA_START=107 /DNA_END=1339 /DNA_ORIENTATION=-
MEDGKKNDDDGRMQQSNGDHGGDRGGGIIGRGTSTTATPMKRVILDTPEKTKGDDVGITRQPIRQELPVAAKKQGREGHGSGGCAPSSASTAAVVVHPSQVRENDVLFGRGSGATTFPGNRRLRAIVKSYKLRYAAAHERGGKARIARQIIDQIHAENGRFLRKITVQDHDGLLGTTEDPNRRASSSSSSGSGNMLLTKNNQNKFAHTHCFEVIERGDQDHILIQKLKQTFRFLIRGKRLSSSSGAATISSSSSSTTGRSAAKKAAAAQQQKKNTGGRSSSTTATNVAAAKRTRNCSGNDATDNHRASSSSSPAAPLPWVAHLPSLHYYHSSPSPSSPLAQQQQLGGGAEEAALLLRSVLETRLIAQAIILQRQQQAVAEAAERAKIMQAVAFLLLTQSSSPASSSHGPS